MELATKQGWVLRGVLSITCATFTGAQTLAQECGEASLSELVERLRARDTLLTSVVVSYSAETPDSGGGPPLLLEQGTLWRGSTHWGLEASTSEAGAPHMKSRGEWNGTEYRYAADLAKPVPLLAVESAIELPFRAYTPDWFGVWHTHVPIAELIAGSFGGRAELLGTEAMLGHDCYKIVLDSNPNHGGDGYGRPMLIWIDCDSLLALCCQELTTTTLVDPKRTAQTAFQGITYFVGFTWTVETIQEALPGLWLPLDCRLLSPGDKTGTRVRWQIAREDLLSSDEIVNAQAQIPLDRWYYVDDRVHKQQYALGPYGKTTYDTLSLGEQLMTGKYAISPLDFADLDVPFKDSSCGPNLVYYLTRIYNPAAQLEEVLGGVPDVERTSKLTTFATLNQLLTKRGFHVMPIEGSVESLMQLTSPEETWAIVAFDKNSQTCFPDHFALAKVNGSAMNVTSIPGRTRTWERGTFQDLWSGKALLVSRFPFAPVQKEAPGTSTGMLVAGGLFLAAAAAWLVWGARSGSRRRAHALPTS